MFVTTPNFEEYMPKGLGPTGGRYWSAMLLSTETPWFLVSYRVDGVMPFTQTAFVAWERTLLSLIEEVGTESVVSMRCITSPSTHEGKWTMGEISEIWLPDETNDEETGLLFFRLLGRDGLWDSFEQSTSTSLGRQLLLRIKT